MDYSTGCANGPHEEAFDAWFSDLRDGQRWARQLQG